MTTEMFLVFSHTLTPEQEKDARESLGVEQFTPLPADLQACWSNVPPDTGLGFDEYLAPLTEWLLRRSGPDAYVLVQGDYGATFFLVNLLLSTRRGKPVYATTERVHSEKTLPDGSVVSSKIFRHVAFRLYQAGN